MHLSLIKETTNFDFFRIEEPEIKSDLTIPLFGTNVSAGFPSPAEDYVELAIDFNTFLIDKPHATFCVKVKGNSMEGAGIKDGALLVVDRSKEPTDGKIVIGLINGDFTVKRIQRIKNELYLMPEHPAYDPILIKEGMEFQVWGVVTFIINKA
jgi:DNA polymerase V